MAIRVYLRGSTAGQDAERGKQHILNESTKHNLNVSNAIYYVENYSGRKLARPELTKLLNDSSQGDIILLEQIDRLTRLTSAKWKELKQAIDQKGLIIVACDVPTSFQVLNTNQDEMQQRILESVNTLVIEFLAASASKDYENRRRMQKEGIQKNINKFKGRRANPETNIKCEKVFKLVTSKIEKLDDAVNMYGIGRATYYRWKKNRGVDIKSE